VSTAHKKKAKENDESYLRMDAWLVERIDVDVDGDRHISSGLAVRRGQQDVQETIVSFLPN
jgi:hypothetical protein